MRTFFPISVIPLPQLVSHKIFFSLPILAIPLPLFFSPHNFSNGIAEIGKKKIFFPPQFQQWHYQNCGGKFFFSHIFGNPIAVFSLFLINLFIYLHLRQRYCRNRGKLFNFFLISAIPLDRKSVV